MLFRSAYAKAMFSGENLPHKLEGEQPEFSDELAHAWATYAPQNEAFMRALDPQFKTFSSAGAAFPDFPGADRARYACLRGTYTGEYAIGENDNTALADKSKKEAGEAFHACMLNGVKSRNIPVHYETVAESLRVNDDGEVTGVVAVQIGRAHV